MTSGEAPPAPEPPQAAAEKVAATQRNAAAPKPHPNRTKNLVPMAAQPSRALALLQENYGSGDEDMVEASFSLTEDMLEDEPQPPAAPQGAPLRPFAMPAHFPRNEDQRTGSYLAHTPKFGLKAAEWEQIRPSVWGLTIQPALEEAAYTTVPKLLSGAAIRNVEEECRRFYGFLFNVLGLKPLVEQAGRIEHLVNPFYLTLFWRFCATPTVPYAGRGLSRSTIRLMCCSVQWMLKALAARGIRSLVHPHCTPANILDWWRRDVQPRCRLCPLGERATNTKGHPEIWAQVQKVVHGAMHGALVQAMEVKGRLERGDGVEGVRQCLEDLQWGCTIAFAGFSTPPLRPACLPTLLQPGSHCPRLECNGEAPFCPWRSSLPLLELWTI